jgi:tetratricopeptide (TPR) repeat protein
MTITLPADFIQTLFPQVAGNQETLTQALKQFYTVGATEPAVEIGDGGQATITLDVERIQKDQENLKKLVSLAEKEHFEEAIPFASELIDESPQVSEYHRILGQMHSEVGNQDAAIDSLIDALKWNPENIYALLMIGNIYANYKNDADTALNYYEQILALKPDDHLALNNIGVKLMEAGKLKQAKQYLDLARETNPDYPNTLHALAMLHETQDELQEAFQFGIKSLKKQTKKDTPLYKKSVGFVLDVADRLTSELDSKALSPPLSVSWK